MFQLELAIGFVNAKLQNLQRVLAAVLLRSNMLNGRTEAPLEKFEALSEVCMTPRSFASTDILKKRIEAFEQNIGTSHWPHKLLCELVG